ncbi:amidase domain-containing protein [Sporosalibacterium faouarense]|uniref:amidase domain-containing protein n=1 Tax=Sporosalibacterium faouarense TaxID=516123 RepID=UPI00141C6769|nr:amidase domain-containing protein [Sporosalibacterium faouarense]MTI49492.1 amidase domain-containing protein [Bacillota bacterium]
MSKNFVESKTGLFPYNRKAAYNYAKRWALSRNPKYYDFQHIGGDCTNFASQVLHAGGCKMNGGKWQGWYYYSANNRAPAWTGVEYLYNFLINNDSRGPIVKISDINEVEVGDLIQLNFGIDDGFDHTPVIIRIEEPRKPENIFIAAHTYDRFDYPLSNYVYENIRYIHILGYKK